VARSVGGGAQNNVGRCIIGGRRERIDAAFTIGRRGGFRIAFSTDSDSRGMVVTEQVKYYIIFVT